VEQENAVLQWASKLNSALAAAENRPLEGRMLTLKGNFSL
jgi:hypothetical protein